MSCPDNISAFSETGLCSKADIVPKDAKKTNKDLANHYYCAVLI
ncbi:MAG: hypothetical protein ACJA0Z_002169 [Halioglobus sp.]|jgi:hypothetical protein